MLKKALDPYVKWVRTGLRVVTFAFLLESTNNHDRLCDIDVAGTGQMIANRQIEDEKEPLAAFPFNCCISPNPLSANAFIDICDAASQIRFTGRHYIMTVSRDDARGEDDVAQIKLMLQGAGQRRVRFEQRLMIRA